MSNYVNIALVFGVIAIIVYMLLTPAKTEQTANQNIQNTTQESSTPMPSPKMQFSQAEQVIKSGKSYTATLSTSAGDITIELSSDTPTTTNNFVFLAQNKFYDGVIFHRVIPGFMIQGGDPTGTGTGGPGYRFDDEEFEGEYKRGVVAMANAGPDTNGSQFFIMHADYPLPPNYVIFGSVTEGLDVVDRIAAGKTGAADRPVSPVTINTVAILEK